VNFAAGVELPEPEVLDSEDDGVEDLEYSGNHADEYPSEKEPVASSPTSTSASSSKPTNTKESTPANPQNQPAKPSARLSGSKGRDTVSLKQATLSSWRSASRPNSTPPQPQQPEPPLDDDVLDLTGTDDEETLPKKLIDADIPTKKLLRPRQDK
jgi:hypothetical protein